MSRPALHDLLHELAEEQRPVAPSDGTYQRARRSYRRGLLLRGLAGTLLVVAVAMLVRPAMAPDSAPAPAQGARTPALPDELHAVPERLAEYHGQARGPEWHHSVAAGALDVGTTATVFPVGRGAVMAVSALDGSYRGLDLPGFDGDAYFRFENTAVALSPDGERLAYTWNPRVIHAEPVGRAPDTGVRIAHLATGRIESVRIESPYGVYAHGFAWSPNGRYLVYYVDVITAPDGRVSGPENFSMVRLDTRTGERVRIVGMPRSDTAAAVSDRGEVAVVGNGRPATWLAGRKPAVRYFEGGADEWTAAWSPSGGLVAAGSRDFGGFSVGDPGELGLLTGTAADAPAGSQVRVLGWIGNDQVVLMHQTDGDSLRISAVSAESPRGGPGRPLVEVDAAVPLPQVSVATELFAREPASFPAPEWPVDWPTTLLRGAVGLIIVAVVALGVRRTRSTDRDDGQP